MKYKEIASAILGSAFFAVPYLGLSLALVPSLAIGGCAFAASELVFSGVKQMQTLKETNKTLFDKIQDARKQSKEIKKLINRIEKIDIKEKLSEINDTVNKILLEVEKNPKKEKNLNNFFDYYLPVLVKITKRYDEIEDTRLTAQDEIKFMNKAENIINDTNKAFKTILSSLYQKDIMDADADMKVYKLMMKADGIAEDGIIKKGSD